jgi:predicted small secreted protein
MQNIKSAKDLKEAVRLLELEQSAKGKLLKEQLYIGVESLEPANLIENTLKNIASSPYLRTNILGTILGLATGHFSKKMVVGNSDNSMRKILGSFLQLGITNIIAQHPGTIKAVGIYIIDKVFNKKQAKEKPYQEQSEYHI